MLEELKSLAKDSSEPTRIELLNRVTRLFLEGSESHIDRERVLYADVVLRILSDMSVEHRSGYSRSIATDAEIPRRIVLTLANDEAQVASPVLTGSPTLTETDILDIVRTKSQHHLLAVTKRAELSETLTDELLKRGRSSVVRSVSANDGARFSTSGQTTLAEQCLSDPIVCSNTLARTDIRDVILGNIKPLVSEDYFYVLRNIVENTAEPDLRLINELAERQKHHQTDNGLEKLDYLLDQVRRNKQSVDDCLSHLVKSGSLVAVIKFLGSIVAVPEHVISNIMFKPNNEPVAGLCRAVGAEASSARQLFELRCQRLRLPRSHAERGLVLFDAMTLEEAQELVRRVATNAANSGSSLRPASAAG